MLRRYRLNFFTQQLTKRLLFPFTYFYEPRNFVKSNEHNGNAGGVTTQPKFKSHLKTRQRKLKEKLEIEKLKKKITSKIESELKGEKEEVKVAQKDNIFQEGNEPSTRKYDKILVKELFWNPRQENFIEANTKKLHYLKEFQSPFIIHDANIQNLLSDIEKIIQSKLGKPIQTFIDPQFDCAGVLQEPQIIANLVKIKELLPKLNYRLYPNIALYLAYNIKYKEDSVGIWSVMETEIFKVLHNLSPIEIAKLRYALAGFFPKGGSAKLHKAFRDVLKEDIPSCDIYELLHIYHAFRLQSTDLVHTAVYQQFLNRDFSKQISSDPDLLSHIIYTYANCRLGTRQRKIYRPTLEHFNEASNLINKNFDLIMGNFSNMSTQALANFATALMITRLENYKDVVLRLEKSILKKIDEFDSAQTAAIIYSYSKINGGLMGGKDDFYKDFEKKLIKEWNNFNNLEKSRILYAYSARKVLSKGFFEDIILPWIKKEISTLDYAQLANISYGLMFQEIKDRDLWKKFAQNISTQKYICPLIHYRPIKIARFYMDSLFPQWDYSPYENTCFESERYFNISRLKHDYERADYNSITKILKLDLNYDIKIWYEWENLFILDYAFYPNKVAILFQKDRDSLPDGSPKPMFKLREHILGENGWKILSVNWKNLNDMGPQKTDWLKAQIDKLLATTKDSKKKDEEERRNEVFANLHQSFVNITKKPLGLPIHEIE